MSTNTERGSSAFLLAERYFYLRARDSEFSEYNSLDELRNAGPTNYLVVLTHTCGRSDLNVIDEHYSFEDPDAACRFYAECDCMMIYDEPVSITLFIGDETKADNFAYETSHEFRISEARDPNSKFVAMMRSLAGKQNVYMTETYETTFFEDADPLYKVIFRVYADSEENADAFDVAIRREFGALMRHMSKFDTKTKWHKIITTINGVENYINTRSQNEFEQALVVLHDKVQKYGIQSVEVMTIRNSDGRVMRRDHWIVS